MELRTKQNKSDRTQKKTGFGTKQSSWNKAEQNNDFEKKQTRTWNKTKLIGLGTKQQNNDLEQNTKQN